MTREEEIKQAAKNRADQYEHPVDWNNCYHHYIQGAEWADQHPRKGLVDIEKVIEWLNTVDFSNYVEDLKCIYVGQLKKDLRRAMEE